jgi:1,4-dihydroxy-2-naphthoate octaprenyltransferase
MIKYKAILESIRPKTLAASICPVFIGSIFAWHHGGLNWLTGVITLLSAALIQIGTNLANDYFDLKKGADTLDRLGPIRATQAGLISLKTTKIAFITMFAMAFICGLYLIAIGGLPIFIIGIISIALGILYTATPLALAYTGIADIVSLLFFGPIAVGGTYYLQTHTISHEILLYGLPIGLLATAILVVNNLRDVEEDRKSQKKTLIVRFGRKFGQWEYLLCILLSALIPWITTIIYGINFWGILTATIPIIALPQIKSVFSDTGKTLNPTLEKTGRLLIIYTLIFSLAIITSHHL